MLKTIDLIKDVEEKYIPMLKMIKIPDFTKCIAQFSGIPISKVKDEIIREYLLIWAKNKYKYFKMLGNKIRLDTPFEYTNTREDIRNEIQNIEKDYPVYAYWLEEFNDQKENKITDIWDFNYSFRNKLSKLFPQYNILGSTITHFFKSCLNAPDELVTQLASIFENQKIKANHTISIDPVDIMLASENPYDWVSCYRLELEREDSHADGCMAAVLDKASLITYIWNREGKFDLYDTYQFKSIRYKRMRQWIALSEDMKSIHFNSIYPGKSYKKEFEKQVREIVENIVSKANGFENVWKKDERCEAFRVRAYGYSEYDSNMVYSLKEVADARDEDGAYFAREIRVFDEPIMCPCGCGNILPGSYIGCDNEFEEDKYEYNGCGFLYENFDNEEYYCEFMEDTCPYSCHDCYECENENCEAWRNEHPRCDLDEDEYCEDPSWNMTQDGVMQSCEGHCENCALWEKHHRAEASSEDSESTPAADNTTWVTINPVTISLKTNLVESLDKTMKRLKENYIIQDDILATTASNNWVQIARPSFNDYSTLALGQFNNNTIDRATE